MASAVSKGRPTLFRTPPALFPSVQRNVSTRSMGRELASGRSDPWSDMLVSKKLRRFIRTRNRSRFRATVPGHLIVLRALPALFGRSLSLLIFCLLVFLRRGGVFLARTYRVMIGLVLVSITVNSLATVSWLVDSDQNVRPETRAIWNRFLGRSSPAATSEFK